MQQPPEASGATAGGQNHYVTLGRIVGVHGIKGWVKVVSDTNPRENIVSFRTWYLSAPSGWQAIQIVAGRKQGKTIVASIKGVDDRDEAMMFVGRDIAVTRDMLPTLQRDEVYWVDLVGCEVFDSNAQRFGVVLRLFETGANDVMVVSDERSGVGSGQEMLIPWVRPDVIQQVDLDLHRIVVDWDPDY